MSTCTSESASRPDSDGVRPGVLYAGVDVGAGRLNGVLVRCDGRRCSLVSTFRGSLPELVEFCLPAARVAVDAPGGLSAGAHLDDLSVAPKFRTGRCSEIPIPGVPAVPWVTPSSLSDAPGWMRTGFSVWDGLAGAGLEVVEAFPAAFFHRRNGGRWPPPKTARAGFSRRLSLFDGLVDLSSSASSGWVHDDVDALACAVVAALGDPAAHACERPDGSAMWLLV